MYHSTDKISDPEKLQKQLAVWRFFGKKIVFTNGCFDLLHAGHADYLEAAAALGDVLIVGLNSDASLRRLKGPARPLVPEAARARLLAAFSFVDMVIFFDEDTPRRLIGEVQPDVLVKGGDYRPEDIVGADIVKARGGEVRTIPLTEGYSSSALIEKIRRAEE